MNHASPALGIPLMGPDPNTKPCCDTTAKIRLARQDPLNIRTIRSPWQTRHHPGVASPGGKLNTDLEGRDDKADEAAIFAGIQGTVGCPAVGAGCDAYLPSSASPWVRSLTHSPEAVIHSPGPTMAAWPTTVTRSRCLRAFVLRTHGLGRGRRIPLDHRGCDRQEPCGLRPRNRHSLGKLRLGECYSHTRRLRAGPRPKCSARRSTAASG